MKEIVLQSGRFATLRPITWWDKVMSNDTNTEVMVMLMACRIVQIDGEPLTLKQAQEMELCEAGPIIASICGELISGMKAKGIA